MTTLTLLLATSGSLAVIWSSYLLQLRMKHWRVLEARSGGYVLPLPELSFRPKSSTTSLRGFIRWVLREAFAGVGRLALSVLLSFVATGACNAADGFLMLSFAVLLGIIKAMHRLPKLLKLCLWAYLTERVSLLHPLAKKLRAKTWLHLLPQIASLTSIVLLLLFVFLPLLTLGYLSAVPACESPADSLVRFGLVFNVVAGPLWLIAAFFTRPLAISGEFEGDPPNIYPWFFYI